MGIVFSYNVGGAVRSVSELAWIAIIIWKKPSPEFQSLRKNAYPSASAKILIVYARTKIFGNVN